VLKKTGYADFDDSDDDTAARAKLEDEGARRAREKLLAGFATLFLITDLYGILREYCYPSSKLRQSLPMNALFRLAADYATRHASVEMFPLDLDDMTQDLDPPGTAPTDRRSAVLDLTNDDPPRHLETATNTATPQTAHPTDSPPKEDDSSDCDGLFDESTIASLASGAKLPTANLPFALPPKISNPTGLPGDFVTALSLLESTPADAPTPSSPQIKQTNGIPEYIYTSEEEVQVPDGCPFLIGDGMFVPPANMTDYRIARRTATELKEIVSFITVYRRLGLSRATGATLMIASLNDGRIKHRTNKSTLNVAYLLQSIDAKDEKERRGVLKKCISEIRNFFEKVYRRHKQTTIRFASGAADSPAPKKHPSNSQPPPSVLRKPPVVAAPSPPNSTAVPTPQGTSGPNGPQGPRNRKRGPAQSSARNNTTTNHRIASHQNNNNKKARKNSQGGGRSPAPAAPSPQTPTTEQPQPSTPPPTTAPTTKKNKNRRRGKGKKNA
jgi:hypothetical protein